MAKQRHSTFEGASGWSWRKLGLAAPNGVIRRSIDLQSCGHHRTQVSKCSFYTDVELGLTIPLLYLLHSFDPSRRSCTRPAFADTRQIILARSFIVFIGSLGLCVAKTIPFQDRGPVYCLLFVLGCRGLVLAVTSGLMPYLAVGQCLRSEESSGRQTPLHRLRQAPGPRKR